MRKLGSKDLRAEEFIIYSVTIVTIQRVLDVFDEQLAFTRSNAKDVHRNHGT